MFAIFFLITMKREDRKEKYKKNLCLLLCFLVSICVFLISFQNYNHGFSKEDYSRNMNHRKSWRMRYAKEYANIIPNKYWHLYTKYVIKIEIVLLIRNSRLHHKKILSNHSILNNSVPDKRQSVLLHLYCPENKESVL